MTMAAHIMPQRGPLAFWRRPCGVRLFRNWGDCSRIAAACNITPQAVSQWKRVPTHHVETVARLLGVTPDRLRPDLAQRKLMTDKSMDPRDAAAAMAQREERTERAWSELEELSLSIHRATADAQRARLHMEDASLAYEQARVELRRRRSAMARARRQIRDAGLPIPDLDATSTPPEPSLGVGGVKTTGLESVDRTPSKLSPPRNS
ncbi:helix-turn-helix domain-containing protein [Komagataeibacter sp. FNDCR2]|uniref:helix-turn-helix domain-containing protein n=1 Tax=Komagataeibacter sp. FNDCR2 TaxID=2878682 RepID=UPI001E634CAE|nr:helix-turn-helix domain-containing protein [Komagataeibacter sp. FNDCR2]MCE2576039.1 helix-turn-helix domain-containing protein [Komagataeibacter sp. FNDCR2]